MPLKEIPENILRAWNQNE